MTLPFKPVFEDASLEHQLVLRTDSTGLIAVSCNCLGGRVIEARRVFPAAEARAVYRAFHDR